MQDYADGCVGMGLMIVRFLYITYVDMLGKTYNARINL